MSDPKPPARRSNPPGEHADDAPPQAGDERHADQRHADQRRADDLPPRRVAGSEPDPGPGWLPAILALGLLLLVVGFLLCGGTTWLLFQKRSELAARTLRGTFLPAVQQSQMAPDEKRQVMTLLTEVADQAESGELENWQASGIMNRLVRAPILEWGDLAAVEALIVADPQRTESQRREARLQLSRLRQAVDSGQATAVDVTDVLDPVLRTDQSLRGHSMLPRPTAAQLDEVIERARLVADRSEVPNRLADDVSLADIVRRNIEAGRREGAL